MLKSANPTMDELMEQLQETFTRARLERETGEQLGRQRLRDEFVTQIREPSPRSPSGPAAASSPAFKIGAVEGYPHVSEPGANALNGNLSDKAATEFFGHMKDAAMKPDPVSRDQAVGRAAKVVARDWANKHGLGNTKDNVLAEARQELRAQATFISREIGQRIGLGPVESTVIGYSLERALEKEGFKVLASHAVDKMSDAFRATTASVAHSSGLRHSAEKALSQSMNWMASHGVTREALKDAVGKHAGKLLIVAEVSQHPEVVQKVASALYKSDKVLDGAMMLARDDEFRKAVGTLAVSTGEAVAGIHKGAGSIAIVGGSMLRGDSTEETGRHAFRAALTVLGGAAGGIAGAGVASLATGTAGAVAGGWLADKVLEAYDKHMGNDPSQKADSMVTQQELKGSVATIANRIGEQAREGIKSDLEANGTSSKVPTIGREYSMGRSMPGAKG